MPTYAYTARDESGAPASGILSADSVDEASRLLRTERKYPISIKVADAISESPRESISGGIKIRRSEVIQLSTQIAIMLETGVTLIEALDCISTQSDDPRLKKLVTDLSMQVQSGIDFSAALARHPRSFPRLYVALIRASEKSGMMSKLLGRATAYLRDEQETLRRVKGALTYPGIMLGFGCEVIGYDPFRSAEFEALGARYGALAEMGADAEIVSLHCPLTPENHHIVNAQTFARMKRGALLVNTSRGGLLDTDAAIQALKSGHLGGLGLDVYEQEGGLFFRDLSGTVVTDDVLQRLISFPNVIVTGHQAFFTREAIGTISETTLRSVSEFARNAPLSNEIRMS